MCIDRLIRILYLNMRFKKPFDLNIGFVLTKRINSHSAERQPSKENEKLHKIIHFSIFSILPTLYRLLTFTHLHERHYGKVQNDNLYDVVMIGTSTISVFRDWIYRLLDFATLISAKLMRYGQGCRQITGQHCDQSKVVNRYNNSLKIYSVISRWLQVNRFSIFSAVHLYDGVRHILLRKFDRISAALLECHKYFNVFMVTRFVIVAIAFQTFFQQQQHPCK